MRLLTPCVGQHLLATSAACLWASPCIYVWVLFTVRQRNLTILKLAILARWHLAFGLWRCKLPSKCGFHHPVVVDCLFCRPLQDIRRQAGSSRCGFLLFFFFTHN